MILSSSKQNLDKISQQLDWLYDSQSSSKQEIKATEEQALAICSQVLAEDSIYYPAILTKIKILRNRLPESENQFLAECDGLSQNSAFKEERMHGFLELLLFYSQVRSDQSQFKKTLSDLETVANQIFPKQKNLVDQHCGTANYQLSDLQFKLGETSLAIESGIRGFNLNPFLHERSSEIGMRLLELGRWQEATRILTFHFKWSLEFGPTQAVPHGKRIEELFLEKKIDDQPHLIALYFFIVRNNMDHFDCPGELDFFNKFHHTIAKLVEKFPSCSVLNAMAGNMYLLDVSDYEKAYKCYYAMLNGDDPNFSSYWERIKKCCESLGKDFFSLPFNFSQGEVNSLYNTATELYSFYLHTDDQRYVKLAIPFCESAYKKFKDYFEEGIGDGSLNQMHVFAMLCNNFSLCLRFANQSADGSEDAAACGRASKINWEGFQASPFLENLENAIHNSYRGQLYDDCLKYINEYLAIPSSEISTLQILEKYWYQMKIASVRAQNDELKRAYLLQKEFFLSHVSNDSQTTERFILSANLVFEKYRVVEEFQFLEKEINWFTQYPPVRSLRPDRWALALFHLGGLYQEKGNAEKAVECLEKALTILKSKTDFEYEVNEIQGRLAELTGKSSAASKLQKMYSLPVSDEYKKDHELINSNNAANAEMLLKVVHFFSNDGEPLVKARLSDNLNIEITFKKELGKNKYIYMLQFSYKSNSTDFSFYVIEIHKRTRRLFRDPIDEVEITFIADSEIWENNNATQILEFTEDKVNMSNPRIKAANDLWHELIHRFELFSKGNVGS